MKRGGIAHDSPGLGFLPLMVNTEISTLSFAYLYEVLSLVKAHPRTPTLAISLMVRM